MLYSDPFWHVCCENIVQVQRFTILDQFFKILCSSLNTPPICTILSMFECREHSEDNPLLKYHSSVLVGLIRSILEGE